MQYFFLNSRYISQKLKNIFIYSLIATIKTKESYQTIFYGNDKTL